MNDRELTAIITAILLTRTVGALDESIIRNTAWHAHRILREVDSSGYGSKGNG